MSQHQEDEIDNIQKYPSLVNQSFVNENTISNVTVNYENSETSFNKYFSADDISSTNNSNERPINNAESSVFVEPDISANINSSSSIVMSDQIPSITDTLNDDSCGKNEMMHKNTWVDKNTANVKGSSISSNKKNRKVSQISGDGNALNLLLSYGDTSSENDEDNDGNGDDDDEGVDLKVTDVVNANNGRFGNRGNANTSTHTVVNDASRSFGDMSLTFPRSQQFIDDDALSLTSSSSSSSSSSSIIFSGKSNVSDNEFDELENSTEESDRDSDLNNDGAGMPKRIKKAPIVKKKKNFPLTAGELTIDDLPAIKDLHISVPKDQCVLLGNILNIVDKLVIVQSLKNIPALNLDTVLFLEWDKPLGKVFDVFGPVVEPLYCVRFNSNEHIQMKDISAGMPVYYVPQSNHTKYVFLSHLLKMKGSDASWEDNNEPPLEFREYSDDEQERQAKKFLKKIVKRKKGNKEPSTDQVTAFERHMNKRNLRKSEKQKWEQQDKKPWKQSSQLIHPPSFFPPPPTCSYQKSCFSATSELTSLDNRSFDVKPTLPNAVQGNSFNQQNDNFFASNSHSGQVVPSVSSNLYNYSASVSPQLFQPLQNQTDVLIPNRPPPSSPWSFTSVSSNRNMLNSGNVSSSPQPCRLSDTNFFNTENSFLSPRQPFPSDIFTSPPPSLQRFSNTPSGFQHSMVPPSHHSPVMFSSPFANFPQNRFKFPSEHNPSPRTDNNFIARPFLPFSENINRIDTPNFNPFSIPPPNTSNVMFSVPPPTVSNNESSLPCLSTSNSSVRYPVSGPVPLSNNPPSNCHSSFPFMGNQLP